MSEQIIKGEDRSVPFVLATGADALAGTEKTDAERKAQLANALRAEVADGARVESQADFQAVVVRGRRPNHLLHFLISLVTIGIWSPVWILITVVGGERRTTVDIDRCGNVFVQQA